MAGYIWVKRNSTPGWVSTYNSDYPFTPVQMTPDRRSSISHAPHANSRPFSSPGVAYKESHYTSTYRTKFSHGNQGKFDTIASNPHRRLSYLATNPI